MQTTEPRPADSFASISTEARVFPPPAAFAKRAWVKTPEEYLSAYQESIADPQQFWGEMGRNELHWFKPFDRVLEWEEPFARWFGGGRLNASYNCLDCHLGTSRENKVALLWEGEPAEDGVPNEVRRLTYKALHAEVCRFANVLKSQGLQKGDRVIIYLPMIPEAAIAMLACTRLGAVHSVVFGGFSAQSVADRIFDSQARMVVTADGGFRRGAIVPLKQSVDEALTLADAQGRLLAHTVERVVVVRRTAQPVAMQAGRDVWWHEERERVGVDCPPEPMESESPLFILYTSGSTGKPKGILHTTGGYLLGAKLTTRLVFDLHEEDVFWCTADVGWVTGHSYVVYGPLANGATTVIYEGVPNQPAQDRFWRLIAKHKVTILYTAPTAIRTFMKWGEQWPAAHDLTSLRLLGSVGEPINPEAWMWYQRVIGGGRCPIVDTWWQTETGCIMIAPLPGAIATKPGSATLPFFGVIPEVVDDTGQRVPPNTGGKLVIRQPWPAMLRGLWGDPQRYREVYWSDTPHSYYTGDGCRQDEEGYFWIVGRIDDVLNVAGHRIGTAEVESAIVSSPRVAEAAVVGRPDAIKGQALVAFVTLKSGVHADPGLREELRNHVAREIGPVAKPDDIRFAEALPKTRSGKIMRRLLREIAAGTEVKGDTTTLEDLNVVAKLVAREE